MALTAAKTKQPSSSGFTERQLRAKLAWSVDITIPPASVRPVCHLPDSVTRSPRAAQSSKAISSSPRAKRTASARSSGVTHAALCSNIISHECADMVTTC